MTKWVIDCSLAAALFLPDESSSEVHNFFSNLSEKDHLFVPALWWYEITNVLLVCERKGRISHADLTKIFSLLERLDLQTDYTTGSSFIQSIYELAKRYNLSSYDAAYLELAIRESANLVSLDDQLVQAALDSGLKTT